MIELCWKCKTELEPPKHPGRYECPKCHAPYMLVDTTKPVFVVGKWDKYFMRMAEHAATLSKDSSTKVGCVIVGPDREVRSTGFNGMPMGVDDDKPERHERPLKYNFFEHAERNAIYLAARAGTALKGATAYIHPWPPCPDCARGLIQAGIKEIVVPTMDVPERWQGEVAVSCEMLAEAGVNINVLEG